MEAIWASFGAWAATPALETISVAANKSLLAFISDSIRGVVQLRTVGRQHEAAPLACLSSIAPTRECAARRPVGRDLAANSAGAFVPMTPAPVSPSDAASAGRQCYKVG
jgi:hypothetical protein